MTAIILSGKEISQKKQQEISQKVLQLQKDFNLTPKLVVILVGQVKASEIYVKNKKIACEKVGMICEIIRFPESVTQQNLEQCIQNLNADPKTHGILIQLPLPKHINVLDIMEMIDPNKDVDGFHPYNIGALAIGNPKLRACTPKGIIELLEYYQIELKSKDVLVIGVSKIVGLPMILELIQRKASVICTHSLTQNLSQKIRDAEIIIMAAGQRNIINIDDLNPKQIIIDVGIHYIDGEIYGDIYSKEVIEKVKAITPVPGGIGPMTISALLENVLQASLIQQ